MTAPEWRGLLFADPMQDMRYLDTGLGPTIQEWLSYLENEKSRAATTRDQYERDVARLAVLFPEKGEADFTTDDVRRARDLFPSESRRRALAAMKNLFHWLYAEERIESDPAIRITVARAAP